MRVTKKRTMHKTKKVLNRERVLILPLNVLIKYIDS